MTGEQRAQEPPRGVPWGALDALLVTGLILVGLVFIVEAAQALAASMDLGRRGELILLLLANTGFQILAALIVLSYVMRRYNAGPGRLGFRDLQPVELLWPFLFVVLAYLIIGVYVLLVDVLGIESLRPEEQVPSDVYDFTATTVLAGIAIVLVAPVAEEIFFRGFLFAGLIRPLGVVGAALVAGVVFGIAHFQPGLFIPFTLVGMLFGGIYYWTKSLWVTILSHLLFNGISFFGMLAGVVVFQ